MNTADLMQGNALWQKHLKKVDIVLGIQDQYILTTCNIGAGYWVSPHLYEGVPLTKDTFKTLGFDHIEYDGSYTLDGFRLVKYEDGFVLKIIDQVVCYKPVKYVHQVQNLYYGTCQKQLKYIV